MNNDSENMRIRHSPSFKKRNYTRDILKSLREVSPSVNQKEDDNISTVISIDIWDMQKSINQESLQKVLQENTDLKNELRDLKMKLRKYREKSEEILKLYGEKEDSEGLRTYYTENTKSLEQDDYNKDENDYCIDFLNENLNKIRDVVIQANLRVRRLENLNKKRQRKGESNFKNKSIEDKSSEESLSKCCSYSVSNSGSEDREKKRSKDNSQKNHKSVLTKSHQFDKNNKILLDVKTIIVNKGVSAIIDKVPRLIPEEFIERCGGCNKNFGLCRWKHHCRVCGYVFCYYCCWNYDNFIPFYLSTVRICDKCIEDKKNKCYLNV